MNKSKLAGVLILEMVFFLPLAIFFGFVVIDFAFYLTDYARVTDVLRSGLNSHKSFPSSPLNISSLDYSAIVDCNFLKHIEASIVHEIETNQSFSSKEGSSYRLGVLGLLIKIDPESGGIIKQTIFDKMLCPILREDISADSIALLKNYYLNNNLLSSSFLGYSSSPGYSNPVPIYRPYSLYVFAKAQITSRSFNPFLTQKLINKIFTIEAEDSVIVDYRYNLTPAEIG